MPLERLQKIIAQSGITSRREAERLIKAGSVLVNGKKVTVLGTKADPFHDRIIVSGKPIHPQAEKEYLLFNKPRKCVVTRDDPEGRKTIYDYLPRKFYHLKPVGRLDYDSQGLLLLTNDGQMALELTHPRFAHQKTYEMKVQPKPGARQLDRLRKGILLDERRTLPAQVEVIRENPLSAWVKIVLQEGRNRQLRRMCEKVGLTVKTLVRTEIGPYQLRGMPVGKWRLL